MRNGLPDHWAEILGLGAGQVNEGVVVGYVPQGQLRKIVITRTTLVA
jgi:hypothetical protein